MTLETILQRIGAYVDQDATTPTSTDLTIRTIYVNEGLEKYAETTDWDHLKVTYTPLVTQASCVSVTLPTNYRKMASPIYDYGVCDSGQTIPYEFDLVDSADHREREYTERFFYVEGNRFSGFNAILPKGLASGTSLVFSYYSYPSSLVTLNSVPAISDPDYLVKYGIAAVWKARGDSRFPNAEAEAERYLASMSGNNNANRLNAGDGRIKNFYQRYSSKFRIGRS